MGEVYRAKDSTLKREVALKVLPADVANDRERLARFHREAEVLASLNHPHIAQIYGIEHAGGTFALVMELVDGEDLSQRIARGRIPIDDALPIARQIVEALEAAHDRGIIHRDLKPANIKLGSDGRVKVLDFGLAKAIDPTAGSSATAMNSPTLSIHATQAGIILGTAAYMSPEQARGKAADRRTDVWAFGCVLFEMLTGTRAFAGDDATDTIVAVLSKDPDWSLLPRNTPSAIRATIRRCLTKDPKQRLRDIADAWLEITELEPAVAGQPSASRKFPRSWILLALVLAVAAGAAGGVIWRDQEDIHQSQWTGTRLGGPRFATMPRVSPDGRLIAFQTTVAGLNQIAVMTSATGQWTIVSKDRTHGLIESHAWSHDGARVYFDRVIDAPVGIYTVSALGGEERLLIENASAPQPLADGSLLFLRRNADRLLQLHHFRPDTGELKPLPALTGRVGFPGNVVRPVDPDRVVFYGRSLANVAGEDELHVMSLRSGEATPIRRVGMPGRLFGLATWPHDGSILATLRDGNTFRVVRLPITSSEPFEVLLTLVSLPYVDARPDGSLIVTLVEQSGRAVNFREGDRVPAQWESGPTIVRQTVGLADGRYLATRRLGTKSQVMVAKYTEEPTPLVETSEDTTFPIAPFGTDRVALLIGSGSSPDIGIIAVDSGRVVKRLKAPPNITSMAVSADDKVVYAAAGGSIVAVPIDGTASSVLGAGDSLTVDFRSGDLVVKLDEPERYRLVWMSPVDGTTRPISVVGDLRMVDEPLLPGAIREGRLLLAVATRDSWLWHVGVLDLQSGRLEKVPLDDPMDVHFVTWARNGSIIASGTLTQGALWKFVPENLPPQ